MNIEDFDVLKRIITRNTLLLMYEPGAAGDFVTALLSVDPRINGSEAAIEFHENGRIKAIKEKRKIYINNTINDYEFYNSESYFDRVKEQILTDVLSDIVTSHGKFISKVHPYFNDRKNLERLSDYISQNYSTSPKIMILRDRDICIKNHLIKNDGYPDDIYYNDEWYEMFSKLKEKHNDIVTIKFEDMISKPVQTMKKIYYIMGYTEYDIAHNFSINTNKIKYIYNTYLNNQKVIEPVKRYWT